MNEQVQKFLEEQKKKAKEERDKHLASLYLYDVGDESKEYAPRSYVNAESAMAYGYYFKDEKGYFRLNTRNANVLQVTDEEYEEICKYCPPEKKNVFEESVENKVDSIRKMLKFFTILTIINLIIAFIIAVVWVAQI